jgi:hypothetical protein
MQIRNIILYILVILVYSNCSTIYYSEWRCTTYDPSCHTFEIDSAYLDKYGMKAAEQCIKNRMADDWIVDSLIYFSFYLEKEKSTMPIIPIFYKVDYHKKNALYNFQLTIGNNKIYKLLDSVSYVLYDSLETVNYKGGYNFNQDITKLWSHEFLKTSYTIDIQLKETDIIYGDIELFFTDYCNKHVMHEIRKIKFKHKEGKYTTSDINS